MTLGWCGWAAVSGLLSAGPHHKESSVALEPIWWGQREGGQGIKTLGEGARLTGEMGATSTRCEVAGEEGESQLAPPTALAPSSPDAEIGVLKSAKLPLPHQHS